MTEVERIEFNTLINRIKDDLWSVRFELKAQKDLIKQIEDKLQEINKCLTKS